jgi:hypothetical protein
LYCLTDHLVVIDLRHPQRSEATPAIPVEVGSLLNKLDRKACENCFSFLGFVAGQQNQRKEDHRQGSVAYASSSNSCFKDGSERLVRPATAIWKQVR